MAPKTRGKASTTTPVSTVTDRKLKSLRAEYPGFTFRKPQADETYWSYKEGELCLFVRFLTDGMELPLPEYLTTFFNFFGLVPAQFVPNTFVNLRGLWEYLTGQGMEWSISNLMALLLVGKKETGFLYVGARDKARLSLLGPPTGIHGWKEKYVFVSSRRPWGIDTVPRQEDMSRFKNFEATPQVMNLYQRLSCYHFSLNTLTGEVITDSQVTRATPLQSLPPAGGAKAASSSQAKGKKKVVEQKRKRQEKVGRSRPKKTSKRKHYSDDQELEDMFDYDLDERLAKRQEAPANEQRALMIISEMPGQEFVVGESAAEGDEEEIGGDAFGSPQEGEEDIAGCGEQQVVSENSAESSQGAEGDEVPDLGDLQPSEGEDADEAELQATYEDEAEVREMPAEEESAGADEQETGGAKATADEDQIPLFNLFAGIGKQQAGEGEVAAGSPQIEEDGADVAGEHQEDAGGDATAEHLSADGTAAHVEQAEDGREGTPPGEEKVDDRSGTGQDSKKNSDVISLDSEEEIVEEREKGAAEELHIEAGGQDMEIDVVAADGKQPTQETAYLLAEEDHQAVGDASAVERQDKGKEKRDGPASSDATRTSASGGSAGLRAPEYWRETKAGIFSFKSRPDVATIPHVKGLDLPFHILNNLFSAQDYAFLDDLSELELVKLQSQYAMAAGLTGKFLYDRCTAKSRIVQNIVLMMEKEKQEKVKLNEDLRDLKAQKEKEKMDHQAELSRLQAEAVRSADEAKNLKALLERLQTERAAELKKVQEDHAAAVRSLELKLQEKDLTVTLLEVQRETEKKEQLDSWEEEKKRLQVQHAGAVAELEKQAEELKIAAATPTLEAAKPVYEASEDFRNAASIYGIYGFDLLKTVLVKDGVVSKEILDDLGYSASLMRVLEGNL